MDKDEKNQLYAENLQVDPTKLAQEIIRLKDDREQIKYELKRKTEIFEANEKSLNDEIEYWKGEHESIKKQLRSQINHLEEEKIRTQNAHDEEVSKLSRDCDSLESENMKLKKKLSDLHHRSLGENSNSEHIDQLENEILNLKAKLENLSIDLNRSEQKASDLEDREMALIQENEEYKESLRSSRQELRKSNELIAELQDEVSVLKRELDDLQYQPRDINTIGNSLFAEVYDSRNQIKEKFLEVNERYQRILKEKESLITEVDILRKETATLREIFNKDMENFRPGNVFEVSGDSASMSAMKSLVKSYKDELDKIREEEPPAEREFQYYEGVIERLKRELEILRGILGDHTLTHSMRARKISELGVQMAYWKSRASETESEKRFLNLKIQELENKIKDLQLQNKTLSSKSQTTRKSPCPKSKPKTPEKPKATPFLDIHTSHKVTFISHEEMKALMENKPYPSKEDSTNSDNKENTTVQENGEVNENKVEVSEVSVNGNDLKSEDSTENAINGNDVKKPKRTIQFSENTKKEDGEGHKPRGRNRYVFNFKVKKLE